MDLHRLKTAAYRAVMGDLLRTGGGGEGGAVRLTFDDGPHPGLTGPILAALAETGTKATFFLSGSEVERYPELAARYLAEGHAVANHGYLHSRDRYRSRSSVEEEFRRAQSIIDRHCGEAPPLFRPPYGTLNPAVASFSLRCRVPVVLWSVDSDDDRTREEGAILSALSRVRPGDVVLFHEDCAQTAALLGGWIRERLRGGMRFASIGP